ncbi:homoserine dehydrogenase [Stygiolobus caldivivus]|uniref:Homoserine dehydrogenase n=1 Tax=Stygiolobus caldivivus TaxID=2824673 RepID=A0A8D5U9Z0_9CREN|nr:homoserine dehydrogenase [Stygiolobus caldivivus]BCU71421.1 homoserine dehydrogenase [Stygiolobus caldivivus]
MKVLVAGYGNVGKAFVKLIFEKKGKLEELKDIEIGGIVNRKGIMVGYKDQFTVDIEGDVFTAYEKIKPDIVVDTMSANYKDGNPSLSLYKLALKDGTSVITTNKAPLALAFNEIMGLVGKGRLGFQGTVMSGTPSINLLRILPGSEVKRIRGILNGTTNFILTMMYNGQPFESALKEAQRLGYAEEDPTLDINGFDAAAKLTILVNFAMKKSVTIRDIKFTGIQGIKGAYDGHKKVKLIAYADENEIEVSPKVLTPEDPLYHIDGVENALEIMTDIQTTIIRGPGAGPINAAYGAFSDLILLKRNFI